MQREETPPPDDEFAYSTSTELSTFASLHRPQLTSEHGPFAVYSSPLIDGDATYDMPVPPPYVSQQLLVGSPSWSSTPTQQPPLYTRLPPSPIGTSVLPSPRTTRVQKKLTGGLTPRKILTDDDRRNICLYHEKNSLARQVDIGELFGVERSTVSKILRQKDKYCKPIEGNQSPVKETKAWRPDIEKDQVQQESSLLLAGASPYAMIELPSSVTGPPSEVNKEACATIKKNNSSSGIKQKPNGSDTKAQSGSLLPKSKVCECPTKEEARHALERAIRCLEHQPNGVAADEYQIINGIMKRLQ